jgi:hypothetical protein
VICFLFFIFFDRDMAAEDCDAYGDMESGSGN